MGASVDKTEMLASALLGARDQAEKTGSWQAQRSLLDFICLVAEKAFRNQVFAPRWRDELERDLLADGYKLIWQISCAPDDDAHVELLPTDAAPVPLAVEITALAEQAINKSDMISMSARSTENTSAGHGSGSLGHHALAQLLSVPRIVQVARKPVEPF
jgi:hypothetical protein